MLCFQGELIGQYKRPFFQSSYHIRFDDGKSYILKRVGGILRSHDALIDRTGKHVLATTHGDVALSIGKCYWDRPDYGDISEVTLNHGLDVVVAFQITKNLIGNWIANTSIEMPLSDLLMAGLLYDKKLKAAREG